LSPATTHKPPIYPEAPGDQERAAERILDKIIIIIIKETVYQDPLVVTGLNTTSPIYPEAPGDQERTAERILDKIIIIIIKETVYQDPTDCLRSRHIVPHLSRSPGRSGSCGLSPATAHHPPSIQKPREIRKGPQKEF
jgi:hypothetical protein